MRSSQRNVYLTGFTLFLSLVLTRVFAIILDLIETQTAYAALKQQVRARFEADSRFLITLVPGRWQ